MLFVFSITIGLNAKTMVVMAFSGSNNMEKWFDLSLYCDLFKSYGTLQVS